MQTETTQIPLLQIWPAPVHGAVTLLQVVTPASVVRATAPYFDVMSVNHYMVWPAFQQLDEQVHEAFERLESRRARGKIVVRVAAADEGE